MHYYGDTSNLNAPYDATTLQGVDTPQPVGGLGALRLRGQVPSRFRKSSERYRRGYGLKYWDEVIPHDQLTQHKRRGVRGLGSVTWDGKTLPSLGYPWRQASNDTLQVQARFNTELAKRDRCPLLLDGDLGPRTCGALFEMSDVSAPDGLVATCSQHAGESTPTKSCPGGVVSDSPLISPPSDSEDPDSSTASDKKGGFPMLAAVGIVGGLVLLAAVLKKKKR